METFFSAVQPWATGWLSLALDCVVKGSTVLILAYLAVKALSRSSASMRQTVWLLAIGSLLAMPALSAGLPGWRVLPPWADTQAAISQVEQAVAAPEIVPANLPKVVEPVPPVEIPNPQPVANEPLPPVAPEPVALPLTPRVPQNVPCLTPLVKQDETPAGNPTPTTAEVDRLPSATPSLATRAASWAAVLWAAGVLACLLPLVLGRLSLWRIERQARPAGEQWLALAERAARQLGLRRRMRILVTDRRTMPMVWGVLRPRLLMPAEADSWPASRRWVVLLHELGHARRMDCLAKLVARVACALYWFNPLAWLTMRGMEIEAEAACDDLVLAGGARPSDYAEHLLQVVAQSESPRLAAPSSIALARPNRLEGRLLRILDDRCSRRHLTRLGLVAAVAVLAAIVLPLSMLRATTLEKPGAAANPADAVSEKKPAADVAQLFQAIRDGKVETVRQLLDKGIDPKVRAKGGDTLFSAAAGRNQKAVVRMLLDRGLKPDPKDDPSMVCLAQAVPIYGVKDVELARWLLEAGAPVDSRDARGRTALHTVAAISADLKEYDKVRLELAALLMKHGADIAARDSQGSTPLTLAVREGPVTLITALVAAGADPTAPGVWGQTAVQQAFGGGKPDTYALLRAHPNLVAQEKAASAAVVQFFKAVLAKDEKAAAAGLITARVNLESVQKWKDLGPHLTQPVKAMSDGQFAVVQLPPADANQPVSRDNESPVLLLVLCPDSVWRIININRVLYPHDPVPSAIREASSGWDRARREAFAKAGWASDLPLNGPLCGVKRNAGDRFTSVTFSAAGGLRIALAALGPAFDMNMITAGVSNPATARLVRSPEFWQVDLLGDEIHLRTSGDFSRYGAWYYTDDVCEMNTRGKVLVIRSKGGNEVTVEVIGNEVVLKDGAKEVRGRELKYTPEDLDKILEKAKPGVNQDNQPNQSIRGRVLDYKGNPVKDATVLLATERVQVVGKNFYPEKTPRTTTGADGRFTIDTPRPPNGRLIVTSPAVFAWLAPLPEANQEAEINLPEPATLTVRYDIPGGPETQTFSLQLNTWEMNDWNWVLTTQEVTVRNGSEVVVSNATPGTCTFDRRKQFAIPLGESWDSMALLMRKTLILAPGESQTVEVVRKEGQPIEGRVTGLARFGLAGAAVMVKEGGTGKDPKDSQIRQFDLALAGPDGTFRTERLPPGKYTLVVLDHLYQRDAAKLARDAEDTMPPGGKRVLPWAIHPVDALYCLAVADVTIPETGRVEPVTLELKTDGYSFGGGGGLSGFGMHAKDEDVNRFIQSRIQFLILALKVGDEQAVQAAIKTLVALGAPAVPALTEAAKGDGPAAKRAGEILRQINTAAPAPAPTGTSQPKAAPSPSGAAAK
jgi:beta-lactamase regulating signal transducer with metallopeptidase domain/ankyrin repeat protein